MIHSNSLKNAKPIVREAPLVNTDQIVMQYCLDVVCKAIKKADENNESYAFMILGERHFTKVTLQILALYGYRVEFHKESDMSYTFINWNKL